MTVTREEVPVTDEHRLGSLALAVSMRSFGNYLCWRRIDQGGRFSVNVRKPPPPGRGKILVLGVTGDSLVEALTAALLVLSK